MQTLVKTFDEEDDDIQELPVVKTEPHEAPVYQPLTANVWRHCIRNPNQKEFPKENKVLLSPPQFIRTFPNPITNLVLKATNPHQLLEYYLVIQNIILRM